MALDFAAADERIRNRVKACTNEALLQPDWAAIIEICDELNVSPALYALQFNYNFIYLENV
jgi:hypothetical protein